MNKSGLFILSAIIILAFLYLIRGVLTPFILAAIFAYILNPLVDWLKTKVQIPRILSIIAIYVVVITLIVYASILLGSALLNEAKVLSKDIEHISTFGEKTIQSLPQWQIAGQNVGLRSLATQSLETLNQTASRLTGLIVPVFTGAIEKVLSVLVFLVASFYFLKDGSSMLVAVRSRIPRKYKEDTEILAKKINQALGGYLRGQILLVIIMAAVTSLSLAILGVQFAIILGLMTGFLELIPFIGPVTAAALAAIVAFLTGTNNFGFPPLTLAIVVLIIYFVLRQIEDYFVIPQLLGRLTRLHPLVVLFSVLAGGSLAGPIGFILGVPVAASLRVLLEYKWGTAK